MTSYTNLFTFLKIFHLWLHGNVSVFEGWLRGLKNKIRSALSWILCSHSISHIRLIFLPSNCRGTRWAMALLKYRAYIVKVATHLLSSISKRLSQNSSYCHMTVHMVPYLNHLPWISFMLYPAFFMWCSISLCPMSRGRKFQVVWSWIKEFHVHIWTLSKTIYNRLIRPNTGKLVWIFHQVYYKSLCSACILFD